MKIAMAKLKLIEFWDRLCKMARMRFWRMSEKCLVCGLVAAVWNECKAFLLVLDSAKG